jgi:WD40 repeat protein/tRNA A-37 threonylcarbamoyl transferase component Bud32
MTNLIGQSLGRYHILEQLGEGGMATVYKAYDTRLERDVAIKVIRTDQFAPAVLERILKRFEREAKSLARLTHPNIVHINDYGEHDSVPYLVMDFLPGGTLKGRMGKPMPWQDAVRLLIPIAKTLDFAHRQGVIHRDVKPSNIIITADGDPMLTDFGIAKILDLEETVDLTGTSAAVGTPEYMAPEQATARTVDYRADIYSLGIVFYEMVTGRRPYQADTPLAVLFKHTSEPLPRPRQFVPDISQEVENILFKALAKKPESRYTSMIAFANALEDVLKAAPKIRRSTRSQPPASIDDLRTRTQLHTTQVSADDLQTQSQSRTDTSPFLVASKPAVDIRPRGKANWRACLAYLLICVLGIGGFLLASNWDSTLVSIYTTFNAPVQSGTPYPLPNTPISPGSAKRVVPLAQWGKGTANEIAWSPNDSFLAVASSTGIYLYDSQTLREVNFIKTEAWVWSVAFSPDGEILASVLSDETVRLWRVSDGKLLDIFKGHTDGISSVAFSPDGETVASGSYDHTVKLWSVSSGSLLRTLNGHNSSVWSVAFSPDGHILASGSYDKTVRLWQVSDGSLMQILTGHGDGIASIAFSPDGETLASGSSGRNENSLRLWRISDGSLLRIFDEKMSNVVSVTFSPDGDFLASGSYDGKVRLWRVSDGSLLREMAAPYDYISGVAFSPDGEVLASETDDDRVRLWRVSDGLLLSVMEEFTNSIESLTFLPDGETLASASNYSTVRLWRISDGSLLSARNGYNHYEDCLAFSPNGEMMAAGSQDNIVLLLQVPDGSLLRTMEGHKGDVRSVAFSPDGKILASGSFNDVRLWQVSDGTLLYKLEGHTSGVGTLAFSPDGETLASGSFDKTVRLWRVSDGSLLRTLEGFTDWVGSLAFSPNGEILASGSSDNKVRLWRVSDGSLLRTFSKHTSGVWGLAFSPDGEVLASGSSDDTLRLWRVSDGSLLRTLEAYSPDNLVFSPDGRLLASGSNDGIVRLWGVIP